VGNGQRWLNQRARVRAWLPCRIGRCGLPDWDKKMAEACAAVHPRRRSDGGRDARHVQCHAGRSHAGDCDRRRARRGCGTTKRMLAYEEINGSPWYLPRLAAEASRYRLTPDPLGCSQQCSGAAIGRLPAAHPTCRRRPACPWMSSTTSAQLREIGCSEGAVCSVQCAPSPRSQLRRGEWPSKRTQPLLTAAASSLHKEQGLVQRRERLLQRSCIAHRLGATVNQQLARP
jgi:hypothetical protein